MQTRRGFLQELTALLSGTAIFEPLQRAAAIEPEPGSTVFDAEHVVILMQENRSFDHAFGTYPGVRGFNDPRAIRLADGNPVWVQSNSKGEKHVPFRLDIKQTRTTWMGSLPHGWPDQVDAANGGKHDRWLDVKRSGNRFYSHLPLTLGYHTREDIPFYHALADAFTICDQNFCSTLTGTTPNRLHLWTGTIRAKPDPSSPALVRNEDCDYGRWVNWTTFPERLEDHGVSWRIYQNELTVPNGLAGEAEAWLANYGDSPIEWFEQFNVRLAPRHREHLAKSEKSTQAELEAEEKKLEKLTGEAADRVRKRVEALRTTVQIIRKLRVEFSEEQFALLPPRAKNLHAKAFTTNEGDPNFRTLGELTYQDGVTTRKLAVPKGDVLHQFRADVKANKLPAVSWLVPPERFSDHPSSAWFGQWYLSEVLAILTANPDVWKKTVFILTYDENDGYFDHVPPFQAPHPKKPETGKASKSIDTTLEVVDVEQDRKHKPTGAVRGNSLGLGFRVPMIIASPWSRGGAVCSQVFDHTSVIRFLEELFTKKTGQPLRETNITSWRRAICGDLLSAFHTGGDPKPGLESFLNRDASIEGIHRAMYKPVPSGIKPLTEAEIEAVKSKAAESRLPKQEAGVRKSCPLPYDLHADGSPNADRTAFQIRFESKGKVGAPFIAYAETADGLTVRHYAVAAGESVDDSWPLAAFKDGRYRLRIHGPNGFFREFNGTAADPKVKVSLDGGSFHIDAGEPLNVALADLSYGGEPIRMPIAGTRAIEIPFSESGGWYDVGLAFEHHPDFQWRFSGRIESGEWSITDPAMA
jgi:phospholipase C